MSIPSNTLLEHDRRLRDMEKRLDGMESAVTSTLDRLERREKVKEDGYNKCVIVLERADSNAQKAVSLGMDAVSRIDSLRSDLSDFITIRNEFKGAISLGSRMKKVFPWIFAIAIIYSSFISDSHIFLKKSGEFIFRLFDR